jgi:hypothetical protein
VTAQQDRDLIRPVTGKVPVVCSVAIGACEAMDLQHGAGRQSGREAFQVPILAGLQVIAVNDKVEDFAGDVHCLAGAVRGRCAKSSLSAGTLHHRCSAPLLQDMSQLMRQQSLSPESSWRILPRSKHHIATYRVCKCVH